MLSTLQDVKVLDFGHYFAGPYASRLLADLGADVIKLEPLDGDLLRPTVKPFNGAQRGKRCISANLKDPRGKEIAHRLAAWADVISHNMRPGAAERLAMDYESVRAINPSVIYAYAPGWGSTGPDASLPGFAPLFSGYVGLHHEAAGSGNVPVSPVGNEDNGNGLLGATAILMALYHRKRTGEGQYLEHPQLNATLLMAMHLMRRPDGSVVGSANLDHERLGGHPLDRLYRTADGWICLSARTDDEFARLCGVPGFDGLAGDPRFTSAADRAREADALGDAIAKVVATAPAATWDATFRSHEVPAEVPAGAEAARTLFDDPERRSDGRVEEYEHARWGTTRDIAVMVRLSGATTRPGRPAPEVGEHTRELLAEFGYSADEITALFESGVVR
ncbi:MAG TPA: CoA transferase [Acidimicrobiia bacterium]|nr:CoA transferase [Acidimicrobiia bacterium]